MNDHLKIAIADDEADTRQYLQEILPILGHQVVAAAENGRELVELCSQTNPDLIIADIKMPEMDGIEAAAEIARTNPIPVILLSAYHDDDLLTRAEQSYVLAYLVKPIKQADLEPAIRIAASRFYEFQQLRKETVDLRQALADRKIIERAKGVLMEWTGMREQDAFRRLQKLASDKNRKLIDISQMIVAINDRPNGSNVPNL